MKRPILHSIPKQFSHPVNFQHNRNLPELAMKASHSKGLKVKPAKERCSSLEAFFITHCFA